MLYTPFFDPEKSYEENYEKGPFGAFADGEVLAEGAVGDRNTESPKFDFFGHKVFSPFGIPAGPLLNRKFVQAALDKGFDLVVYKTVRTRKYPCHQWPNVLSVNLDGDLTLEKAKEKLVADQNYHEPLSITNSFGVPSMDPELWQKDLTELVKNARPGQVIIGGFQGTKEGDGNIEAYIEDYRKAARLLLETGVQVFEVNLSCPNEGTAALLCYDAGRSKQVVTAIKEVIGNKPLIIKMAYYNDTEALRNFLKEVGSIVDGISAINTIAAEIIDKDGNQALPGEGRQRSGVCGHSIKWAGLDMVKKLKVLRAELGLNYKIIGVGGVNTPEDFDEYMNTGADFVMSATGAMWNPYLARDIKQNSKFLKTVK